MSATIRKARLGDRYAEPPVEYVPIIPKVIVAERPYNPVSYRKESVLKTIADMRAEIGRMNKLADQLEAELLRVSD